jgi:ferredoxin
MPTIKFVNEKKEIQVPAGANLRREAIQAGVQVYKGPDKILNCMGFGICGTCRVLITKGMDNASKMGLRERVKLKYLSLAYIGHEDTMRLSCQTQVNGDMDVVTTPDLNLFGENFFS